MPTRRVAPPTKCAVLIQAVTSARITERRNAPNPWGCLPAGFFAGAFFAGGLERADLLLRVPEVLVDVREAMLLTVSGTCDRTVLRNSVRSVARGRRAVWPSALDHDGDDHGPPPVLVVHPATQGATHDLSQSVFFGDTIL